MVFIGSHINFARDRTLILCLPHAAWGVQVLEGKFYHPAKLQVAP